MKTKKTNQQLDRTFEIMKYLNFEELAKFQLNSVGSDIEKLAPIVAKWEGGYVNDPIDKGGATNMGITIGTWKLIGYDKNGDGEIDKEDIKLLDEIDFSRVLQRYWDRWRADEIHNQSIANILVGWVWGSGKWGIVIPQRDILEVDVDGIVGPQTISKLNSMIQDDAESLFFKIKEARKKYFHDIVNNSVSDYEQKIGRKATEYEKKKNTQYRFLKGWLNRLEDYKFESQMI